MKELYKRMSLFTGTYLVPVPDLHECTELYQNQSLLKCIKTMNFIGTSVRRSSGRRYGG